MTARLVRSALVWLGYADPVATIEAARADDPSRSNLRAVVAAWRSVIGPPMSASEIKNWAGSGANDPDHILFKALNAVARARSRNDKIDALRLGHWFRNNNFRANIERQTLDIAEINPIHRQTASAAERNGVIGRYATPAAFVVFPRLSAGRARPNQSRNKTLGVTER